VASGSSRTPPRTVPERHVQRLRRARRSRRRKSSNRTKNAPSVSGSGQRLRFTLWRGLARPTKKRPTRSIAQSRLAACSVRAPRPVRIRRSEKAPAPMPGLFHFQQSLFSISLSVRTGIPTCGFWMTRSMTEGEGRGDKGGRAISSTRVRTRTWLGPCPDRLCSKKESVQECRLPNQRHKLTYLPTSARDSVVNVTAQIGGSAVRSEVWRAERAGGGLVLTVAPLAVHQHKMARVRPVA
jgi:hypothetical protein